MSIFNDECNRSSFSSCLENDAVCSSNTIILSGQFWSAEAGLSWPCGEEKAPVLKTSVKKS